MRVKAKETVFVNDQIYEEGQEFVLVERRGKREEKGKLVPCIISVEQQFNSETMERLDPPAKAAKGAKAPKAEEPGEARA